MLREGNQFQGDWTDAEKQAIMVLDEEIDLRMEEWIFTKHENGTFAANNMYWIGPYTVMEASTIGGLVRNLEQYETGI